MVTCKGPGHHDGRSGAMLISNALRSCACVEMSRDDESISSPWGPRASVMGGERKASGRNDSVKSQHGLRDVSRRLWLRGCGSGEDMRGGSL